MSGKYDRSRKPRSPSASSDPEDDSRHQREGTRYHKPEERYRGQERKRGRGEDAHRDNGPERRRPRRSYSPTYDDYNYNSRRNNNDDHHASSRRVRSQSRSPPPYRSKPTTRRSRSPINHSHRRPTGSPYQKPRDYSLTALEKNPTSGVGTIATTTTTDNIEKQKPNYAPTGLLAAESNTVNGIVLKYNEPAEARKPPARDAWRLYAFKGSELLETVHLGERSCWLFGRERAVVDFPIDHPSCSKQHAVIQFRFVEKKNEFGDRDGKVRPYIIDLGSANSTLVNKEQIPASRYVELRDKDMLQFGLSTREYVLMLPPE
ncbi:hypothetical protein FGG08_005355 [Glutinoglossum americanum]|uniref:FHA domain-containing protein n=1 Tax=Glutinoglossum americanum TaxID=1670608 RepID=A0A9P8I5M8_9PEZI|nr:hypothetical protein FGG08_005355 [Glutinoglossum americanum]